jgi:hypothetical protein
VWLLPLLAFAAPLAVAGVIAVPMVISSSLKPRPKLEPLPPPRADLVMPTPTPASQPAPRPQPAAPPPVAAPLTGLSPDDARAYQSEIEGLQASAKNNDSFAKQYSEIGSSDKAVDRLREASAQLSTVACLSNQRKRAVPFYEAKARCKAAEG